MLTVENITATYERPDNPVVRNITLSIRPGELLVILGPNGAGKSSLLRAMRNRIRVLEGKVLLDESNILLLPPHRQVTAGIAYVPEGQRVFESMNVEENILMGAFAGAKVSSGALEEIYRLFPLLKPLKKTPAGQLSGGERQMVSLARAFISNPRVLLLDEPSLGLAPAAIDEIYEKLSFFRKKHEMIILMVEQNAARALDIATHVCLLRAGCVFRQGVREELSWEEELLSLCLGSN